MELEKRVVLTKTIKKEIFDGIYSFPNIAPNEKKFTFHYLHPGTYYLTIVCDKNKDGYASHGDITSKSQKIIVDPNSTKFASVNGITIQN